MKVVLMRDISRLGQKGQVVEVKDSFAMNVLIPKGDAKMATPQILKELEQKEKSKLRQKELSHSIFLQTVEKLTKNPVVISGKRHQEGSLFATVSVQEIVDVIHKQTGVSLNPKQVHIEGAIKRHGSYTITLEEGGKKEQIQVIVKA